ncbi:MAG: FecR domain-containing protein [Betaproteobacteria bacterium]|nr:FecR domain-containing protein [Betaproteobacteria bacterium]
MSVFVGDRVETSASGHVHLKFVDDAAVAVRPDSSLEIQAYRFDAQRPAGSEVRLQVEHGIARSISGRATEVDKNRFRLNTPVAAIGVRGAPISSSRPAKPRCAPRSPKARSSFLLSATAAAQKAWALASVRRAGSCLPICAT